VTKTRLFQSSGKFWMLYELPCTLAIHVTLVNSFKEIFPTLITSPSLQNAPQDWICSGQLFWTRRRLQCPRTDDPRTNCQWVEVTKVRLDSEERWTGRQCQGPEEHVGGFHLELSFVKWTSWTTGLSNCASVSYTLFCDVFFFYFSLCF
jgi:hypothetical protein